MKIKKKYQKVSLINYSLLRYQVYNSVRVFGQNFKSYNTNLELKQVLKIIYLYNKNKKKILFAGFPYNQIVQNQLNHSFISKNCVLRNYKAFHLHDLIILNYNNDNDKEIVKHLKSQNVPLIVFGSKTNKVYKVNGLFETKTIKKFCLFLIFSIIKNRK